MFGEKLKALRVSRGMSKTELAAILNVHPTSIGKYENNGVIPNIDTCKYIARIFDVSLDYLMGSIHSRSSKSDYTSTASAGSEIGTLCESPDDILDMFYSLSPEGRASVISHMQILRLFEKDKILH